jgi:hypothetical protein
MGEINSYKILVRTPEGKRSHGRSGIDGRIILEWILGKQDGKVWTGFIQAQDKN